MSHSVPEFHYTRTEHTSYRNRPIRALHFRLKLKTWYALPWLCESCQKKWLRPTISTYSPVLLGSDTNICKNKLEIGEDVRNSFLGNILKLPKCSFWGKPAILDFRNSGYSPVALDSYQVHFCGKFIRLICSEGFFGTLIGVF